MRSELLLAWLSPVTIGALVAAILIICASAALTLRLRALDRRITLALARFEGMIDERHRQPKQRPTRPEEPAQANRELRGALDSLRSMISRIPSDTARQVMTALEERSVQQPSAAAPQAIAIPVTDDVWDEPAEPEDGLAQLLAIANRIVQQSSTTLDAFRASTGALATRVVAWPGSADGMPVAFIVEHRGAHYAVPNVVKPARLPKEWFNRSEFGVNDEIQRVLSLPRLRRHPAGYDVQEAGVFGR